MSTPKNTEEWNKYWEARNERAQIMRDLARNISFEKKQLDQEWDKHEHIVHLALLAYYYAHAKYPDNSENADNDAAKMANDHDEYKRWQELCRRISENEITTFWQAVKELETPGLAEPAAAGGNGC